MTKTIKKAIIIFGITSIVLVLGTVLTLYLTLDNSFWTTSRSINLTLEEKEKLAMISIDEQAKHPTSMEFNIAGTLDGKGLLRFGWSDTTFYRTDTLSENFDIHYNGDWYSDTTYFKYEPISATKGHLTIDCKIFSGRK